MSIIGNMVGCYSPIGKTFTLVDESGNEITMGVVTDSEVVFTATDNDVREGMVYASDTGVSVGNKTIPSYHTEYGSNIVLANNAVIIETHEYNYSNLLVTIMTYNISASKSTFVTYVSINNGMYAVGNSEKISDIVIDEVNEQINLGLTVPEKSIVKYLVTREEF